MYSFFTSRISSIFVFFNTWLRELNQMYAQRIPILIVPLKHIEKRSNRIGLCVVSGMMIAFTVIIYGYISNLHAALGTYAEDLGIMDQVIWNTAHGNFWRETICNPIGDTNCLAGTSRWAIHFEPSMLLLVPSYWIAPSPNTLQFIQAVGIAIGAIPAYLLGSRRFGSVLGGIGLAVVYLTMPALRAAAVYDFHMVTLSAPALMFAIYFMYSRQIIGFIIAIIFAMGTKEQIPIDVFMLGFAAAFFQQRWRLGIWTMIAALVWVGVALNVMRFVSPIGMPPVAGRYDGGLIERISLVFSDQSHRDYIFNLIANTGGIGLLAPWVLLLASPSAMLNALSSYSNQYSGWYQYNADIVPFLVLSVLEGIIIAIQPLTHFRGGHKIIDRWRILLAQARPIYIVQLFFLAIIIFPLLSNQARALDPNRLNPWPQSTPHTQLATRFFDQIPSTASVTAQAALVPHLSHRPEIYQYPSGIDKSQYILLDMIREYYPYSNGAYYAYSVQLVLQSGDFDVINAEDGYILLHRRANPDPLSPTVLPSTFCPTYLITDAALGQGIVRVGNCDPTVGAIQPSLPPTPTP
jgi:uncharacterized membrane protein